jgi:N-acetyl-anhydromuramyl-L-alanine amidase AmpD
MDMHQGRWVKSGLAISVSLVGAIALLIPFSTAVFASETDTAQLEADIPEESGAIANFSANFSVNLPDAQDLANPFQTTNTHLLPIPPSWLPSYAPKEENAPADPTNYDTRVQVDIHGNPVYNDLIVVLHETVGSADSAINLFQTPHPRDEDQVSYHALIRRDGTIVYIVPIEMRAFGAGNSVFENADGTEESVQTNPAFPPSVNNFAYHISLESPSDGRGNSYTHSGYTEAQYQSVAWLVAKLQVPEDRVTTHEAVDRSGSRMDPRSFDFEHFFTLFRSYLGEKPPNT